MKVSCCGLFVIGLRKQGVPGKAGSFGERALPRNGDERRSQRSPDGQVTFSR
jgi:hypothetical protein